MICENTVKKYCKDNIKNIKNYDEAIADKDHTWDCHHILEITPMGKQVSTKYLKEQGLYYNQPAEALVFLTHFDHSALHNPINIERATKVSRPHYGRKFIRCIESGKILCDSDWRDLGFTHAHEAANGTRKTVKGLHFEFVLNNN